MKATKACARLLAALVIVGCGSSAAPSHADSAAAWIAGACPTPTVAGGTEQSCQANLGVCIADGATQNLCYELCGPKGSCSAGQVSHTLGTTSGMVCYCD